MGSMKILEVVGQPSLSKCRVQAKSQHILLYYTTNLWLGNVNEPKKDHLWLIMALAVCKAHQGTFTLLALFCAAGHCWMQGAVKDRSLA